MKQGEGEKLGSLPEEADVPEVAEVDKGLDNVTNKVNSRGGVPREGGP